MSMVLLLTFTVNSGIHKYVDTCTMDMYNMCEKSKLLIRASDTLLVSTSRQVDTPRLLYIRILLVPLFPITVEILNVLRQPRFDPSRWMHEQWWLSNRILKRRPSQIWLVMSSSRVVLLLSRCNSSHRRLIYSCQDF